VKKTVYVAELFAVLTSPATGATSTLTLAGLPKAAGGTSKPVNVRLCRCPAVMKAIDCCF
jgi:hypothetical protein